MRNAYTRVLLGNLDIERIKFPNNSQISGQDIDVLARRWLWQDGLDYGHGTGHGVGYFLNVHEGPHGISKYRA
jgi:Xaa-Pro aminopeptidase